MAARLRQLDHERADELVGIPCPLKRQAAGPAHAAAPGPFVAGSEIAAGAEPFAPHPVGAAGLARPGRHRTMLLQSATLASGLRDVSSASHRWRSGHGLVTPCRHGRCC